MAQDLIWQGRRLGIVTAGLFALMLCLPTMGGQAMAADAADTNASEPASSYADQVKAALAADPEGGDDLAAILEALIATQPDGAQAAVTMMIALGSIPTQGMIDAVSRAIKKAQPYTADQLQNTVESSVESSTDPISAVRGVLAVLGLSTEFQSAIGKGLGEAVSALNAAGKGTDAAVIAVEINKAPAAMKQSYDATQSGSSTSGTQQQNGGGENNAGGSGTNTGSTPEQPASDS
jgi:hypothetical protein